MAAGVTLPLWLVILAGVLALIGLLDRLLVPSVRWFIRSRANKVLDEVGSRLRIEIRPFQHTRRQALIDRLLYDDKVQQAAAACMRAQNLPRELVMARIQGYARVAEFGAYLMDRIGKLIPVLPVPLVALVFERNPGKALSELEIKSEVELLIERLETAGAHVYVPRRDRDYAITAGLRMMLLRHMVEQRDGLYAADPAELTLLRYYANSIAHLLTQK
jgi:glycerol-3-phosphate O-acyltransferase